MDKKLGIVITVDGKDYFATIKDLKAVTVDLGGASSSASKQLDEVATSA